jgi:hypothetical protein
VVVEINQPVHHLFRDSRVAVSQALNFQEKHDFHDFRGNRIACTGGMTHHQIHLQRLDVAVGDPDIAQRAKARVNTVDEFVGIADSVVVSKSGRPGFCSRLSLLMEISCRVDKIRPT